MKAIQVLIMLIGLLECYGQSDTVLILELENSSFEDPLTTTERRVNDALIIEQDSINYWKNEGDWKETPPDLHEGGILKNGVYKRAAKGNQFVGLVARFNDTYESVSQSLGTELKAHGKYLFYIELCTFKGYEMARPPIPECREQPAVLRVCGRMSETGEEWVELYRGEPIDHEEWQEYLISFIPSQDINEIRISAFWRSGVMFPYNGNVLIDAVSPIYRIK